MQTKQKAEKAKKTNNMRRQKGITLIALIVTIVVLIILATVSIYAVLGENGLIRKAQQSGDAQAQGTANEEAGLGILDQYLNDKLLSTDKTGPTISAITQGTVTHNSIAITITAEDENGIATYQYFKKATSEESFTSEGEAETSNTHTYSGLTAETNYTIKVVVTDKAGNTSERETSITTAEPPPEPWTYDRASQTVTNGVQTLAIGDYVDYDHVTGATTTSYTSEAANSGYSSAQTYNLSNYTYGWRVMGVNEQGQVLLIAEDLVPNGTTAGARNYLYLSGQKGYQNGINELNNISAIYGQGAGAVGARSVTVEDVNTITGYDPEVAQYKESSTSPKQYGNKVTYKLTSSGVSYIGTLYPTTEVTNGSYKSFTYLNNNGVWTSLTSGGEGVELESTYYKYYPHSLTTSSSTSGTPAGISKTSAAYKMLFTNSSTGASSSSSGSTSGFYYWLGSSYVDTSAGNAYFGMRAVRSGSVRGIGDGYLYYSHDDDYYDYAGVRPVVILSSDITFTPTETTKDGCALWDI